MSTAEFLRQTLLQLDRQSYAAYKSLRGRYQFPEFYLIVDAVQSDPFAAPSRLRVQLPQRVARLPPDWYASQSRRIALCDYLTRQFDRVARSLQDRRGSGNSGLIAIASAGQQVLERTSILVSAEQVEARFVVGLPAAGRRILGRQAAELLCDELPVIVQRSLEQEALAADAVWQHLKTVEDADWLRSQLAERKLVAFVPDGAMLPRQSGVDDRPLCPSPDSEAIQFRSPESLRVTFDRPHQGQISGMGIPQGITLIVGGGYHGKSTLLQAIGLGVYNHLPGDGREQLVTEPTAVKIRAEDGRSVAGVNLSPFINHLPLGRSTQQFSTENASGSTSQAASILEALEAGAKLLLIDEDTSATNFMIRDRRMQALIAKAQEPITPLIDKIRQLYQDHQVSTVLVMGGSGDYFEAADTVIALNEFLPQDVTAAAQAIARQYPTDRQAEGSPEFGKLSARVPVAQRLDSPSVGRSDRAGDRLKVKVRQVDELRFGNETIDLAAVEQLVDLGQLRAIGAALAYLQQHYLDGQRSIRQILDAVMAEVAIAGLDGLTEFPQGDLAAFRPLELAAALNRLRSLQIQSNALPPTPS